jgi:hypothetical protein
MIRAGILLAVVVAGNYPLTSGWASERYHDWREHRPAYLREYGEWDVVADGGTRSVHAALLHTGKVLLMAGSGNNQNAFDAHQFTTVLWDPAGNTFQKVATPYDVFCSGHSFLPDGDLLIAGGTAKYEILAQNSPDGKQHDYQGLRNSYLFDPDTSRYEKVGFLNHARWYPTLVTLADGSAVAVSGLDQNGAIDPGNTETFDAATRAWVNQPRLRKQFPTYPSLLLTADGRLFYSGANSGYGPPSGPTRRAGLWNLTDNAFQPVGGLPEEDMTETAGTVLLPPAQEQKIMFIGGGGVGDSEKATPRTAIVDLTRADPAWTPGPDLTVPKRYPGVVVLPDDTVLVSGGSQGYRARDSLTAQIYHPDTNTFTTAADPHVGRDYHSEYLLLPDGRVAVFGSNPLTEDNRFETRVEVYSPPYMFRGDRPAIRSAPGTTRPGTTMTLRVSGGTAKVRLIRPGAYTHVTDTEQRSVALPILRTAGGTVTVSVPANPNLLPPDWYMLFVDNGAGVPSTASWVHVE